MPQMAPMNWLILFILFISMFSIIMNLLYFNFLKFPLNKNPNQMKLKNYNKFI